MKISRTFWILSVVVIGGVFGDPGKDYNKVNNDGSFSFGLSNNDIGGHYHEADGSPDKIVRGRYGARSPASGRIEETVYTAGPRGFRARGPRIHRKMDLSQYPRGPTGIPGDRYGDPHEDPSYGFNFRSAEYERRENADSSGRVRGLYSYLDDVGERHTVRYAAGAGTGFEVLNSVPDSPANVAYNSPLYKAPRGTRGRMSTERGPDGQYRFILAAPDHRRSESSGPDGVVRGSYSYLDDKGIQRTIQYVAGAGIGYRIVQSTTGAGTHQAPRPAIPELGIRDHQSNDLADDGYLKTSESGRFRPTDRDRDYINDNRDSQFNDYGSTKPYTEEGSYSNRDIYNNRDGSSDTNWDYGSYESDNRDYTGNRKDTDNRWSSGDRDDRRKPAYTNRTTGYDYNRGTLGSNTRYGDSSVYSTNWGSTQNTKGSGERYDEDNSYNRKYGNRGQKGSKGDYPSRDEYSPNRNQVSIEKDANRPEYYEDYDRDFPLISSDRRRLHNDRSRDWIDRGRDSTVIKNVGKWYVGLPPGGAVRAHVQNIDLLPLGGRQPSPSEALRRDELASA